MDLDAFVAEAVELLAIPSTADRPDQLRRALDLVLDIVGPGFVVERFESNGKPSALLWCQAQGLRAGAVRPEFRVILNAHLDVVPAEPDQFRPRLRDGRLYARGAQDMKVSGLLLTRAFRELAPTVPYPLALQLVADEEVGGQDGTRHQLELGVTGTFVIIGEHSGLDIVADSKGLAHARLRAAGRGAHGAYPWLGDNALVSLIGTVNRLLTRYPVPSEEVWQTTVNLARMTTPNEAINQIPGLAQAWLDIRFPADDAELNGRTPAQIADHLLTFCEPGVTVEVDDVVAPHHTDHDRTEVTDLRHAAQAQGYPSRFLYKHGSGDSAFYSERGIAAVAFGVQGSGQHGPDEYAEIASVGPYYRALTSFLGRLGPAPPG
jgi:succinyl-diaminopimelate desuccinylase